MHERGPVSEVVASLGAIHRDHPVEAAEIVIGPTIDLAVAMATFEHIVGETDLASIDVSWTRGLDTLACFSCGLDYPGTKLDTCPRCGGPGLVVDPVPEAALGRVEVGR